MKVYKILGDIRSNSEALRRALKCIGDGLNALQSTDLEQHVKTFRDAVLSFEELQSYSYKSEIDALVTYARALDRAGRASKHISIVFRDIAGKFSMLAGGTDGCSAQQGLISVIKECIASSSTVIGEARGAKSQGLYVKHDQISLAYSMEASARHQDIYALVRSSYIASLVRRRRFPPLGVEESLARDSSALYRPGIDGAMVDIMADALFTNMLKLPTVEAAPMVDVHKKHQCFASLPSIVQEVCHILGDISHGEHEHREVCTLRDWLINNLQTLQECDVVLISAVSSDGGFTKALKKYWALTALRLCRCLAPFHRIRCNIEGWAVRGNSVPISDAISDQASMVAALIANIVSKEGRLSIIDNDGVHAIGSARSASLGLPMLATGDNEHAIDLSDKPMSPLAQLNLSSADLLSLDTAMSGAYPEIDAECISGFFDATSGENAVVGDVLGGALSMLEDYALSTTMDCTYVVDDHRARHVAGNSLS